jgi:hypothetical protein
MDDLKKQAIVTLVAITFGFDRVYDLKLAAGLKSRGLNHPASCDSTSGVF